MLLDLIASHADLIAQLADVLLTPAHAYHRSQRMALPMFSSTSRTLRLMHTARVRMQWGVPMCSASGSRIPEVAENVACRCSPQPRGHSGSCIPHVSECNGVFPPCVVCPAHAYQRSQRMALLLVDVLLTDSLADTPAHAYRTCQNVMQWRVPMCRLVVCPVRLTHTIGRRECCLLMFSSLTASRTLRLMHTACVRMQGVFPCVVCPARMLLVDVLLTDSLADTPAHAYRTCQNAMACSHV